MSEGTEGQTLCLALFLGLQTDILIASQYPTSFLLQGSCSACLHHLGCKLRGDMHVLRFEQLVLCLQAFSSLDLGGCDPSAQTIPDQTPKRGVVKTEFAQSLESWGLGS